MTQLNPGDVAPGFELYNADGNLVRLSDHAGQRVIVYFFPRAMTPGCTTQAVDFTESHDVFTQGGYDIIGISPDDPIRLATFRGKWNLTITMCADPEHEVMQAYGAWGTRKLYGKVLEGVLRSTFIINVDEDGVGVIEKAMYNVRASGHVDKLIRELDLVA